MDIREELKSAGVYPVGPCSAWPLDRNERLQEMARNDAIKRGARQFNVSEGGVHHAKTVKASAGRMAGGLLKAAGQAMRHGKVSEVIRNERYDTCKACPAFIEDSKRCSECGCFMEAKTWIGGDPKALCPLKKWER